jgi:hypothetical protein
MWNAQDKEESLRDLPAYENYLNYVEDTIDSGTFTNTDFSKHFDDIPNAILRHKYAQICVV